MESLLQDIRYALRMLYKSPGFTVVAILTLALGIGANTAIFSVVDAVILRPLPFKDASRIVTIDGYYARRFVQKPTLHAEWADWAKGTKTLEDISIYEDGEINLAGRSQAIRVQAAEVSANFFDALGVQPLRGRTFTEEEEESGAQVALLNAGFWREQYEDDPSVIGKAIELNGKPFTVIGILPTGFNFPKMADIWLPLPRNFNDEMFGGNAFGGSQIARLRSAATIRQARAELEVIEQRENPDAYKYNQSEGIPIVISSLHSVLFGNARTPTLLIFGAAGFVLFIACADVANLLVGRSAGRSKEVAIRAALGASRSRLLQQFLCESVLFALIGGGLGLMCSVWTIAIARLLIPSGLLYITQIGINGRVLAFTFGVSVVVGLACGLIPAMRLSKVNSNGALNERSARAFGRLRLRSHNRLRSMLGISEIALALLMLVGAGLFLRSLGRLLDVSPGFRSANLLTARLTLKEPKYSVSGGARSDFLEQVLARIQSQSGVLDAAAVNALPFGNATSVTFGLDIEGKPPFNPDSGQGALFFEVSENYFHTMGIPLLEGRYFASTDVTGADPVAIVSEEMALQCWPNENPLGKRFSFAGAGGQKPFQVVGVAGDIRNFALGEAPRPAAYFPIRQMAPDDGFLVVQVKSKPTALVSMVRDAVKSVDKNEPISSFATMDRLISQSVSGARIRSIVLGTFGGLALLLAVVGIYAVMSYAVTERTHEIGVRMALGAQRGDVLRMVIREGMVLAGIGIAVGTCGALALTRLLRSLLFDIKPTDAVTFASVAVLLVLVALAACYIPARRATKVDPMVALRYE
jgi:putative ABC transport system permease protein